jgi:hypothetical protein
VARKDSPIVAFFHQIRQNDGLMRSARAGGDGRLPESGSAISLMGSTLYPAMFSPKADMAAPDRLVVPIHLSMRSRFSRIQPRRELKMTAAIRIIFIKPILSFTF